MCKCREEYNKCTEVIYSDILTALISDARRIEVKGVKATGFTKVTKEACSITKSMVVVK